MTLYEQIQEFLDKIHFVSTSRSVQFINMLKLQSMEGNKPYFKYIFAYTLVKYLEEFQGIYTDTITKDRLYHAIKFLECYFNVYFGYDLDLEYTEVVMPTGFLFGGDWNDELYWDDNEFWND